MNCSRFYSSYDVVVLKLDIVAMLNYGCIQTLRSYLDQSRLQVSVAMKSRNEDNRNTIAIILIVMVSKLKYNL